MMRCRAGTDLDELHEPIVRMNCVPKHDARFSDTGIRSRPLILSFVVGDAALSWALAKARLISRWNPWMHGMAVAAAVIGGAMASSGLVPAQVLGLAFLGVVSGAQRWVGVALGRRQAVAAA
jgi:hypothetical protein